MIMISSEKKNHVAATGTLLAFASCLVLLVAVEESHAFSVVSSPYYSMTRIRPAVAAITQLPIHDQDRSCASRVVQLLMADTDESTTTGTSAAASSSSSSEDDWYSDFNPDDFKEYEEQAQTSSYVRPTPRRRSSSGGGGGGGGGQSYGNQRSYGSSSSSSSSSSNAMNSYGHDYERDIMADDSNVNLEAVHTLLADRLHARKTREFDRADALRDQLLHEHGVNVWDREKTWRSGCSASGSGMGGRGRGRGGSSSSSSSFDPSSARRGSGGRRPPRDFGPLGHDYHPAPDAGPIQSALTEDQINAMIAERLGHKMSRNFRDADALQEELQRAGVFVHDGRKEWRADGVLFGEFQDAGNGRPGRERGSRNAPYEPSSYSEAPDNDDVAATIAALVAKRSAAKQIRNYMVADDIRDQLRQDYNTMVDDRLREWSIGGDFGPNAPGAQDKVNRPYTKSPHSEPGVLDSDTEEMIAAELVRRAEAKKNRDFEVADEIRERLMAEFNVVVNDRFREWSVGGDFGEAGANKDDKRDAPFVRRGGGDLSDEEVDAVVAMIEERAQAKKKRDFQHADAIRDDLEATYSVKVDDRSREWRVMTDEYVCYGSHQFDDETLAYITEKLKERSAFKIEREYGAADAIRDELRSMGISVDDRTREWSMNVAVDEYSTYGGENRSNQARTFEPQVETAADEEFWTSLEESVFAEDGGASPALPTTTLESAEAGEEEAVADSSSLPLDTATGEEKQDFSSLTVVVLKEKLRESGLKVSGTKAELIERLTAGVN